MYIINSLYTLRIIYRIYVFWWYTIKNFAFDKTKLTIWITMNAPLLFLLCFKFWPGTPKSYMDNYQLILVSPFLSLLFLFLHSWFCFVFQGEVEQEKFDSYDVHFFAPSREEIEEEVRKEGSLKLERLEMFEMDKSHNEHGSDESYGTQVAVAVRAIQESMISHHFGEGILESLFQNFAKLVDEEMAKEDIRPISFVLVLRKI